MAALISEKINFKRRTISIEEEGHYIIIKSLIHYEHLIINVYTSNNRASKKHEVKTSRPKLRRRKI